MTVAAFVVSVLALLGSVTAIVYSRRSAIAADRQAVEARRQADAADEQLRMAAVPLLTVTLKDEPSAGPDLLYEVRNDGPQDLASVLVRRPETLDKVRYPLSRLGGPDFEDEVELGPLTLGDACMFLLKVGPNPSPPEFRVRITCRAGSRSWVVSHLLEPRPQPFKIW